MKCNNQSIFNNVVDIIKTFIISYLELIVWQVELYLLIKNLKIRINLFQINKK